MRTFISAKLKIERANKHIADLDAERVAFLATDPCKARPQYDAKADRTSYVVAYLAEIPPAISLIAGDAVHNLRSALDHLAASLVRDDGKRPSSGTGFPIFESVEKYNEHSLRKIERMSSADQKRIGAFKPYHGGNDLLWGLHRLDIIDKHDLLITHAHCVGGMSYRFSEADMVELVGANYFFGEPPSTEKLTTVIPFFNPFPAAKLGDVILSMPGNLEANQDIHPAFDISLGNVEVFKGRPILPTLHDLSRFVEDVIFAFR